MNIAGDGSSILWLDNGFKLYKTVSTVTTGKYFVWFPIINIGRMYDKVKFQITAGTSFCSIPERTENIKETAGFVLFSFITYGYLYIFGKDTLRQVYRKFDPCFLRFSIFHTN